MKRKAGISCHEPFVEVLLASIMVSGKACMEKERRDILEAAKITPADVYRIADYYEPWQRGPLRLERPFYCIAFFVLIFLSVSLRNLNADNQIPMVGIV